MKKHDVWLRLLALILAFILWIIAREMTNPTRTTPVEDISLTITGEDELKSNYGLSVIEYPETVDITVRGPVNEISNSRLRNRITAVVDVSGITDGAGEYTLPVRISTGSSDIEANSVSVRVLVDEVTTEAVPVRVDATGTPATGYRAGTPEPTTTKELTIEGPASELAEVAYAYGTVDVSGRNSTFTSECQISLYNDAGEPITGTHVTTQTDTVTVRAPIYPVESIPLAVTLTDGDTLTTDQVDVDIKPRNISLLGDQNTLASLTEINLGTIDLDTVRTGVPIEMEIPLPDGVRLDAGQPSTAQVTITVKAEENISTRSVQVTNFVPTDTAQSETPYSVEVLTDSVEIELRGSASALEQVDLSTLSVGLTFDSVSLGEGTHKVRGVIAATGLPAGVTLVEQDVEVEIRITGSEDTPADGGAEESTPPDDTQPDDTPPEDAQPEEGGADA